MTNCFVIQFDLSLVNTLQEGLQQQGFTLSQPVHTIFQAKKEGISCTLYSSGKLSIQGKGAKEFIEFYLEPEVLGTFGLTMPESAVDPTPRMGIDESGKGDFFGPLCIAGVYGDEKTIPLLLKLGVKDSKQLQDSSIRKIAKKIQETCPYHVIRLMPRKYNELMEKFGNLNLLLAWCHATVIETLHDKTGCQQALIDQFAAEHVVETALKKKKKPILLTQRTKAESDPVVAAASILARYTFIEGMRALEEEVGLELPKGASNLTIAAGKQLVGRYGEQVLVGVSKIHFKTREKILSS